MGWNTYLPGLDAGYTSPYAHLRQVIASRSARDVPDEIDELVIKCNPMAFGTGIPLFGHHPDRVVPFAHERTRSFESGVVISEYVRA